jgi:hypothetical protein
MGLSAKLRYQNSKTNSRVIEERISSEMRSLNLRASLFDGKLSQKERKKLQASLIANGKA